MGKLSGHENRRRKSETNLLHRGTMRSIVAMMEARPIMKNYKLSSPPSQLFIQKFSKLEYSLVFNEEEQGRQVSSLREELSPFNGRGNFLSKASTPLVCIVLFL
ncbi:hypothetical protein QL285_069844 [Trifolium repens]|nr:hypothetical protein QL285_069844 [Trifolium repens]